MWQYQYLIQIRLWRSIYLLSPVENHLKHKASCCYWISWMYIIVNTSVYPAPDGLAWECSDGRFYSCLTLEYYAPLESSIFLYLDPDNTTTTSIEQAHAKMKEVAEKTGELFWSLQPKDWFNGWSLYSWLRSVLRTLGLMRWGKMVVTLLVGFMVLIIGIGIVKCMIVHLSWWNWITKLFAMILLILLPLSIDFAIFNLSFFYSFSLFSSSTSVKSPHLKGALEWFSHRLV